MTIESISSEIVAKLNESVAAKESRLNQETVVANMLRGYGYVPANSIGRSGFRDEMGNLWVSLFEPNEHQV